jgi:signal transduction histidine kinase
VATELPYGVINHTPGAVTGAGAADREVGPIPVPPLSKQLQPWHWVAIDCVVAVLLAVVFLVGSTHPAYGIPMWVAYVLALVSTLPAAVRRIWPLPVLGLVLAGSVASMAIGTGKDPSVVVAFVLYLVALRYRWRVSLGALAGTVALTVAGAVAGGAALSLDRMGGDRISGVASHIVTSVVVIVAAWMIGAAVRQQRAYTAGLREQAERRVQAQLAEARREVNQERLRIARELHDVVAHGLSLIAMQAGVGHYVARAQPEEAERALASIEATSRTALREMRRLVGVLRDGDPAGPGLEPAPGLADLGRLITGTADAGVRVQLEVRGARCGVPPGVDLAAYRIVQEALTNVVKHAQITKSRVVVTYEPDAIGLEITDEGHGAGAGPDPSIRSGHGLAGMRERAALYGGEFHAGPQPGRGFRVAARLPLDKVPGEPVDGSVT